MRYIGIYVLLLINIAYADFPTVEVISGFRNKKVMGTYNPKTNHIKLRDTDFKYMEFTFWHELGHYWWIHKKSERSKALYENYHINRRLWIQSYSYFSLEENYADAFGQVAIGYHVDSPQERIANIDYRAISRLYKDDIKLFYEKWQKKEK